MNHAPLFYNRRTVALIALSLSCPISQAGDADGYLSSSSAAGSSAYGAASAYYAAPGSGIESREVARRRAYLNEAMQLLQEGRNAYDAGKYTVSLEKYQAAWDRIPKAPSTTAQQKFIIESISDASIAVAQEYSKVGRYDEAEQLLLNVLSRDPNNKLARKVLSDLRDPIRNTPTLTPEHVKDVEEVNRLLTYGRSYYEQGLFDKAYETYSRVLAIDPYNSAAVYGQLEVNKRRQKHAGEVRLRTRADALLEVSRQWDISTPVDVPDFNANSAEAVPVSSEVIKNDELLSGMMIQAIDLQDIPMEEALDFLRGEARKNNVAINFIFEKPLVAPAKAVSSSSSSDDEDDEDMEDDDEPAEVSVASQAPAIISRLNVQRVTGKELLQMMCAQAGCQYRIDENAITIYQIGVGAPRLFKRQWRVTRDFFTGADGADDDSDDDDDDFGGSSPKKKRGIDPKARLINAGVTFPAGATAHYSPRTSILTVNNTPDNLDATEDEINEHRRRLPQMIKVTTKIVEISQTDQDELGFDWVVNPFSVSNSGNTFLGGGGYSNSNQTNADFVQSGGTAFDNKYTGNGSWPISGAANNTAQGLVTGGNRTGAGAISGNSLDAIVASGSTYNNAQKAAAPGILSLTGVYDSGSLQMIMRGLSQKKGVDVMSAPSLLAQAGDVDFEGLAPDPLATDQTEDDGAARIEVVRRFIYPISYSQPQIVAGGGNNNNNNNNNGGGGVVAAPAHPEEWAVEEVGIVMRFKIDEPEGTDVIKFNRFEIKVVDFEGFINYGSPITNAIANELEIEHMVLTENRIDMPIFSRRYMKSNPCVYDGYTLAMGGLIEEEVQKVEDKVPILGDLPFIGRLFRTEAESHQRKNLMVFVTAELVDPTGRAIRNRDVGTGDVSATATGAPSLFEEDGINP